MDCAECGFGNRTSIFANSDRRVITHVRFRLPVGAGVPVTSGQVAGVLEVRVGEHTPADRVRDAVLTQRPRKGLLLDSDDPDTRSAGAFFVNPIVEAIPAAATGVTAWREPGGHKLSAAWLIEQAGFAKGYGAELGTGRARLSGKLASAVSTRDGATTAEVLELARTVSAGVRERFGTDLKPACALVGCAL